MDLTKENLTGIQKAAILLVTLGSDTASKVLKELNPAEAEMVVGEIAKMKQVVPELKNKVLEEFYEMSQRGKGIIEGGAGFASELLRKAVGGRKAQEMLRKAMEGYEINLLELIKSTEPEELTKHLKEEHPQIIALVLAFLPRNLASQVLLNLSEETSRDVIKRMAITERVSPQIIKEVTDLLGEKLDSGSAIGVEAFDGVRTAAELLSFLGASTAKEILDDLEKENPEMAQKMQEILFIFEDVALLDDRSMQRLLKEIDTKQLTLALKAANEEVKNRFLQNMSERAQEALKEDMELLGPVKVSEVEEAQRAIAATVRNLSYAGEVIIPRKGGEGEDEYI